MFTIVYTIRVLHVFQFFESTRLGALYINHVAIHTVIVSIYLYQVLVYGSMGYVQYFLVLPIYSTFRLITHSDCSIRLFKSTDVLHCQCRSSFVILIRLELRCVIAVIRHGDRTPKQKMKMVVTHVRLVITLLLQLY